MLRRPADACLTIHYSEHMQILKAAVLPTTMLLSYLQGRDNPNQKEVAAAALVVCGTLMCTVRAVYSCCVHAWHCNNAGVFAPNVMSEPTPWECRPPMCG